MNRIIYEDNHLIAVTKRSGEIVQGDKTGDKPLSEEIKSYLKTKYKKPGNVFLGTIHRLDRPTSGIILYARTSKALKRMNEQFRNQLIEKTYWAIVDKHPPDSKGTLENYLIKNQKKNKSVITDKKGKYAMLDYKVIKQLQNFVHLEIKPKTGRHHQIRVQLANIGCIIKGDIKYGAKRSNKDKGISLVAKEIKFTHPITKREIIITAPIPNNTIWKACK